MGDEAPEAYTAQESARTGHTVLTTIHSNSCEATYSRMRTLCKRKYDMDDEVLMDLVTEAFPIVVFTKQLENKKRRLMEIMGARLPGMEKGTLIPCSAMRLQRIGWKGISLLSTVPIKRYLAFQRA